MRLSTMNVRISIVIMEPVSIWRLLVFTVTAMLDMKGSSVR